MASPTVVQVVSGSSTTGDSLLDNGEMFINLPNPAKVGNSLAVCFEHAGSVAGSISNYSCTDDQGNSYTGVQGGVDGDNDQAAGGFYAINLAAEVKQVKVKNIRGDNANWFQVTVVEMNDVTEIDVTNHATGTGTAARGGSLAVTQAGDFVLLYVARTHSVATTSFAPASQENMAWRQVSADINDGHCLQAGVYNSASAFDPQNNMGTGTTWASVAMAFKAGDSGAPRSAGMVICGIHHTSIFDSSANPLQIQVPAIGNLLVVMRSGGVAGVGIVTSITDNKSNAWSVGTAVQNDASMQRCHAASLVTADDLLLTVNLESTLGHHTYMIYDIAGAHSSPLDDEITAVGTQGADADLTTVTIVPSSANGLILGMVSWAHGTANGLTDPAMTFDAVWWDGEPVDGPTNCDENNGWGHIYNPDTSARTFTWQKTEESPSASGWESWAVAFKAALE
jgi:hypothetical protein